jgi:tetratricopeptide (TPR) repeat protein
MVDWRAWSLDESVLVEPIPGTDQAALWIPAGQERGTACWERIAPLERAGFAAAPGICAVPARVIRTRRRGAGLFGRWFRRPTGQTWILPNGQAAEQLSDKRNDLHLVWSENPTAPFDLASLKSRWPDCRVQQLGKNLYLVDGTAQSQSGQPATAAMEEARLLADQLLRDARAAGDLGKQASALADLGAVYLQQGKAEPAIKALGEALAIARQLGERSREADILGNLGAVTLAAGHGERARELFEMELALAREAGDRFAEKLALERIGMAYARLSDSTRALAAFEQALALARAVGHRKHVADLLWSSAIQHAELRQRDQAIACAQAALDLWRDTGNPQAAWFAEHLRKYQAGETSARQAPADETETAELPQALLGANMMAGLWANRETAATDQAMTQGPGLLRMAVSATKSMAKFIGSGFKTASPQTLQQRLQTCAACEHHTGLRCRLCGCFTTAKARLAHEECPLGKWVG